MPVGAGRDARRQPDVPRLPPDAGRGPGRAGRGALRAAAARGEARPLQRAAEAEARPDARVERGGEVAQPQPRGRAAALEQPTEVDLNALELNLNHTAE